MSDPDRVEVGRHYGGDRIRVKVEARIGPGGELILEGHDLGEVVDETLGDADLEYRVTVSAAEKDRVLLRLLRDRYREDPRAVSSFRAWLDEEGLEADFESWT